ncbi:helix-turn-helix domain-containing protein [Crossiella sp. CA198]|uniref:helix-turn-helix domain-containing protein n=1 Tax=Crossiella sp. CA198 TaxID=3455607 RepID=UPI003F8D212C
MIEYWFRSSDVDDADQSDYWHEAAAGLWGAADLDTSTAGDIHAVSRTLELGGMSVSANDLPGFSMRRTSTHVRRHDPEVAVLTLLERGDFDFAQGERQTSFIPGDLFFYHTSAPLAGASNPAASLGFWFPRALLPTSAEALVMTALSGRDGLGALVAGSLRELAWLDSDRDEEAALLAPITLDLLAALCHRELGTLRPANTTPAVLLGQVRAFIRQHLADPALDRAMIAAAHHISVRYLQRLFQQEGQTVAGWIRDQRLEQCRRDLANPALRERPAHAVARRWGFTDSAHFNRVFRTAFGLPPGEYRKLARLP